MNQIIILILIFSLFLVSGCNNTISSIDFCEMKSFENRIFVDIDNNGYDEGFFCYTNIENKLFVSNIYLAEDLEYINIIKNECNKEMGEI